MRVLVADDDATTRDIVTVVLNQEGYACVIAVDGAEANQILQQPDAPQIVILDWLMPHMDGLEVVKQIRARPTNNPPYILMLTSKAADADLAAGLAAGANDYLVKPFRAGELRTRMAAASRMVQLQTDLNVQLEAQQFQTRYHQLAAAASASLAAVSDGSTFEAAVNTILQQFGELFAADRSYLFRFTPDLTRISVTHEWIAPGIASLQHIQDWDITDMTWGHKQILAQKPLHIADVTNLPPEARAEKAIFLAQDVRSLLCLPTIGTSGQLTGFIGFDMVNRTYAWSPEQITMLQSLVGAVGSTMGRLQAEARIAQHQKELNEINRIGAIANTTLDLDTVLNLILENVTALMDASVGMIFLKEPDANCLTWGTSLGLSADFVADYQQTPIQMGEGLTGTIAQTGQPIFITEDASHDSRIARAVIHEEGLNSFIGVPILAGETVVGVMNILTRPPALLNKEDVDICSAIGSQVGLAISNARLYADQQQAKADLSASEARLRSYIEHAPHGLLISDENGRYLEVNPATCTITGYDEAELLAMQITELHIAEESAAALSHFEQVKRTGFAVGDFTFRHKSGENRYWRVSAIQLSPDRIMAFTEEITERKLAEEALRQSHAELATALQTVQETQEQLVQQERLAAVGQLAAGIAHDFNNILAVILLYAQMMAQSQLPPWEVEATATIEKQTKTAAHLVQQILDFSRRAMLEKSDLDWLPLLKEQAKLLTHTLPDNIVVTFTASAPGPYLVQADATRLQQMVLNLAVNARDAMPHGGQLHLELDKLMLPEPDGDLAAGHWLRLQVRDTGEGVAEADRPYIFEPFFTTKEPGQGSGLGLAQAQGIVLQHGGQIVFETAVNRGTTFTIYLPAIMDTAESVPTKPFSQIQAGGQEMVLLVEDNAAVRQALITSLQVLNYQVTAVTNGQEAIDFLEANPNQVDAILSDMIMPDMGGAALFHQVQQQARLIPMVIITGHRLNQELDSLVAQGLAGWLAKPPDLHELANLLNRVIATPPTGPTG